MEAFEERRRNSTKEMELCQILLRRSVGHSIIRVFSPKLVTRDRGIGDTVNAELCVLTIPIV